MATEVTWAGFTPVRLPAILRRWSGYALLSNLGSLQLVTRLQSNIRNECIASCEGAEEHVAHYLECADLCYVFPPRLLGVRSRDASLTDSLMLQ